MAEAETAAARLDDELAATRAELEATRQAFADERQQRQAVDNTLAATQALLQAARDEVAAGETRIAQAEAAAAAAHAETDRVRQTGADALAQVHARADAEQDRLMRLLDQARTDHRAAATAAEQERREQLARIEALSADLRVTGSELAQQREIAQRLRDDAAVAAAGAQQRERQLIEDIRGNERTLATLEQKLRQAEGAGEDAQRLVTSLRETVQTLTTRAVTAETRAEGLVEALLRERDKGQSAATSQATTASRRRSKSPRGAAD